MTAVIRLIRPVNCLMGAIGIIIGAIVGLGWEVISDLNLIIPPIIVAFFFMAGGNALNDYYDRDTDKVNHPKRPIPSGRLEPRDVLLTSILLFIMVLILAWFINLISFIVALFAFILMVAYEVNLKRKGFAGNVTIGALVGLLFIFGGAAVGEIEITIILGLLAFFATIGREIVKDIEDIEGDIDRTTLPKSIGTKGAGAAASISLVLAVILSPVPYCCPDVLPYIAFEELHVFYLYIVIFADIVLLASISMIFKAPRTASNIIKVGMAIALAAFIVGAVW